MDGMLTRLIAMVARGRFMRIGRGENYFHLTYIDDLINGLLLAGIHPAAAGEDFILAGPSPVRSGDLIALVETRLCRKPSSLYLPENLARPLAKCIEVVYQFGRAPGMSWLGGAPPVTIDKIDTLCRNRGFSAAKAAQRLGYKPHFGIVDGVQKTIEWMAAAGRLPAGQKVGDSFAAGATEAS
jgi:nucleoside-diphosphate-sugar epimerase